MISINTKLVGLLGKPLNQTFAPLMHNETFKKLNLDYLYIPFEVDKSKLDTVINGMKNMNFVGFNVTKPYKIEIIKYLDQLDDLAEKIGAVNNVIIKNGQLIGYNTDGEGFVQGLIEDKKMDLDKSVFYVFGAGGASRAICTTLAYKGAKKICIVDKEDQLSKTLVNDINFKVKECAEYVPFVKSNDPHIIEISDAIINASGVGMYPNTVATPLDRKLLRPDILVCDLTYNPMKTQLLLDAEDIGCDVVNGIPMLINQGMYGFSLWTGVSDIGDIMKQSIDKITNKY